MKEIYAVIRPGKDRETKATLGRLGCMAMTTMRVRGRGKQRGLRYSTLNSDTAVPQFVVMKYMPKKMIYMVINDVLVKPVIQAIIGVNQTGEHGDGKIFVMESNDARRIRTGESGEETIQ